MQILENRFLAFIDVLGFKYIVEKTNKAFDIIKTLEKAKSDREKFAKEIGGSDMEVTWFSDSIVISYPADYINNLTLLLQDIKEIQKNLITHKILIRGGVALEKCYHKKGRLFGVAMNKAYGLESTKAIVPRVVIGNELIKYLDEMHEIGKKSLEHEFENSIKYGYDEQDWIKDAYIESATASKSIKTNLIKRDRDGMYFVDYLEEIIDDCIHTKSYQNENKIYSSTEEKIDTSYNACKHIYEEIFDGGIRPIKELIKKNLKNNSLDIILKYMWLKEYFNSTVEMKKVLMSKEFIEDFYAKLLI